MNKLKAICCLTLLLLCVGAVAATFIYSIPTSGIISSKNLAATPDTIDWGFVVTGVPITRTVSLQNIGNMPFTDLNMTISNIQGLNRFAVDWNLEGTTIEAGKTMTAAFTLTVYEWSTLNFSFDIELR